MRKKSILSFIKKLKGPIFTTYQLSSVSGRSSSAVTQALTNLAQDDFLFKIHRGVWAEKSDRPINPYAVIPFLFTRNRAYVSFISALHLYGIVEQIPQVITLASTSHARAIHTKVGTFYVHRITPPFFDGFTWYKGEGSFLIAEPEKALIDSIYISAYKKKQFGYFPELYFSRAFSFKKARAWAKKIPSPKARSYVNKKLGAILKKNPPGLK